MVYFFFNDTATTEIYTLSLHDALPIFDERWERAARRYEGSGSRILGDFSMQDPARWSASLDELFPAQRVPFEDITVMTARDFDAVLTRHYGDYMQPPPEDQRANHQASTVVLGPNAPDSE